MKGVFEKRPALPKYSDTWEVDQVLDYFNDLPDELDLKELTIKLVLMLAILSGQRCQTIHMFNINDMKLTDEKCIFYINALIKQSRPGKHVPPIELSSFLENRKLCVVTTLQLYLEKTKNIRKAENQLFISFSKPYKAVSKDTLARWIKEGLKKAGIDTAKYSAHSTRAATASAASHRGVSVDTIMKAAGWSRKSTFSKYYKKKTDNMAQDVLKAYMQNSH